MKIVNVMYYKQSVFNMTKITFSTEGRYFRNRYISSPQLIIDKTPEYFLLLNRF